MTPQLEDRLLEIGRKIESITEVCAAVSDDTLRMCFALDELHRVGALPPVPWQIATAMVELHHAKQAEKHGLDDSTGESVAQRIEKLQTEIDHLRRVFAQSVQR